MRPNCTLISVFSFATDLFHRKIDCYVSFLKDHNRKKKSLKTKSPMFACKIVSSGTWKSHNTTIHFSNSQERRKSPLGVALLNVPTLSTLAYRD